MGRELPRRWRRLLVVLHVVVSVGWLGAGAANLVLAAGAGAEALDAAQAYLAIQLIDTWVVIPAAFGALVTGVVLGLGTSWGLVRHWWVLIKLVLTVVVILSSTVGIGLQVELAVQAQAGAPRPHLVIALAVANLGAFVLMTWLSVRKPRGLTRWGRRSRTQGLSSRGVGGGR